MATAMVLSVMCVLLSIEAWQVVLLSRKVRAQERMIVRLDTDLKALVGCARGVGNSLHAFRDQLRNVKKRQEQAKVRAPGDVGGVRIQEAEILMRHGAEREEIARICGLSHGEVELLARLDRDKQAA